MFHVCDLECKEFTNKDHPIPGRWVLGEEEFDRCPRTYLTEDVTEWILGYRMFKNGFPPNDGGWIRWPSKYLEVMYFIDSEMAKHERQVQEKNGRK